MNGFDLFDVKVTVSPLGVAVLIVLVFMTVANYRKRKTKVRRAYKSNSR